MYDYDLECGIGTAQPYLCEITSIMATLTEGQIYVNTTQIQKQRQSQEAQNLENQNPIIAILEVEKIVGIKC